MAILKKGKKMYGLLGENISYSLSPVMHNAAFKHFGIKAAYKIFDVEEAALDIFFRDYVLNGKLSGFNVTVPYKIRIREAISASGMQKDFGRWANILGAINTIKIEDGECLSYNTDAQGFYSSLTADSGFKSRKGKKIFIIGAGGAGRAICLFLAHMAASSISVHDADENKLTSLRNDFVSMVEAGSMPDACSDIVYLVKQTEDVAEIIKNCDLVINATPLGTKEGDPLPIDPDILKDSAVIYDLVYARETELVKRARERGLKVVNGLGMLINQAALAFEIWTGKPFKETKGIMAEAVLGELGKRK